MFSYKYFTRIFFFLSKTTWSFFKAPFHRGRTLFHHLPICLSLQQNSSSMLQMLQILMSSSALFMRLKLNIQVRFDLETRSSILCLLFCSLDITWVSSSSEEGDLQLWTGSNSAWPYKEDFLYVRAQRC